MRSTRAEQAARALRAEYGQPTGEIDVTDVAKWVGADVVPDSFADDSGVSGVLVREGDHAVIGINQDNPAVRQRFTVAHELGHLRLHPGQRVIVERAMRVNFRDRESSMATNRQEIEANQFAAELLMPADDVLAQVERRTESGRALQAKVLINELAEHYNVSSIAMGYRLTNLGVLTTSDWEQ